MTFTLTAIRPGGKRRGGAQPCRSGKAGHISVILNFVSLFIGLGALVCALVAFIPLLGWANWLIIPFAVVGLALGAMSSGTAGRNLNIVVIAIGALRLTLGGGIL